MADHSRVFDGFSELSRGMDGSRSPSLIGTNQVAAAVNATFRGAFVHTRPPIQNQQLTFKDDITEARFTGRFQGACFYTANPTAHIISRGGRLFRIETDSTGLVTEITPKLTIVTTADFTVPAPAAQVTVDVASETVIPNGATVIIDSGTYTVVVKLANQLILAYVGGAAHATVAAGADILDSMGNNFVEIQENPSDLEFVYLFQGENYIFALAAPHRTAIYDGSSTRLAGVKEIPPGLIGLYVWGRDWLSLFDSQTFMAGDLIHTNSLADASDIYKYTENTFFNEGGTFSVPTNSGPITAMLALATQDNSLGQGNLLVGTRRGIFSVNTPVDRATWKDVSYPIQTVSLIDYGPTGPHWPQINGDWWYRSQDGFRSFIVARRQISTWGNTPMSREVAPIIENDTDNLLFFGSGIFFDNRFLATVSPHRTELGISHLGLAVLNFDLLSTTRDKALPAWEGAWSGLDILQLTKGITNGVERGYAWVNRDGELQLWELLTQGYYDQFNSTSGNQTNIVRTAIPCWLETRSMDFTMPYELKGLRMAELYLDKILDTVNITIKFRPDQYPDWITWTTMSICANVSQCQIQAPQGSSCSVWKTRQKQYAARIRIPKPPENCNTIAGTPVDTGYEFQFRIEWTGSCEIRKFRPHANVRSQPMEGVCPPEVECKTFESCDEGFFDYTETGPAMA